MPSAPTVSILISHQPALWKKFENALRAACRSLRIDSGVLVTAGIGSPVGEATQMAAALDDAETAALWADLLGEPVIHHQDVAHLRMLPKIGATAGATLRDALTRFTELARYDMRHGSSLLRTLDAYLTHRCSVTDTAAALYIHRNTLRQRLGRIEELTQRPTDGANDWTVVALAARLALADGSPDAVALGGDAQPHSHVAE